MKCQLENRSVEMEEIRTIFVRAAVMIAEP